MKWFWLTAYDVRTDFYLLHELKRGEDPTLLSRYQSVDRCRVCGKFDGQQILDAGFDLDRIFRMPQDMLPHPNDILHKVVTEQFKHVCEIHRIGGVEFIPCGQSKSGGAIYVMLGVHRSDCLEPVEQWARGIPLEPGRPAYYMCHRCGCPERIIGFPRKKAIIFPDEFTISIPSISTEMRMGPDFRFFCSDTVRKIFKAEKIKGCCFSEMEQRERLVAHHQAVRAEIEARKANE